MTPKENALGHLSHGYDQVGKEAQDERYQLNWSLTKTVYNPEPLKEGVRNA